MKNGKLDHRDYLLKFCQGNYSCNINGKKMDFDKMSLINYVFQQKEISSLEIGYAINQFFLDNELIRYYQFTPLELKYLNSLRHYEIIDFEYLNYTFNKRLIIKDINAEPELSTVNNFSINEEFLNHIISKIPLHYNTLEKAIFSYLYLCNILSYDIRYYNNEESVNYIEHWFHNYLETINLENNKVICLEFTLILAKIFDYLNINYHFRESVLVVGRHTKLSANINQFMISFDSSYNRMASDFFLVKNKKIPKGMKCFNQNDVTKELFDQTVLSVLEKIYELPIHYYEVLDSLQKESMQKQEDTSFNELFSMFQFFLSQSDFQSDELICYICDLAKDVFYPKYSFAFYVGRKSIFQEVMGCLSLFLKIETEDGPCIFDIDFLKRVVKISNESFQKGILKEEIRFFNQVNWRKEAHQKDFIRKRI